MTNEYKTNVMQFIFGTLPENSSIVEPQYKDVETTANNLYTQIHNYFSSRVAYVDFVPAKNVNNQEMEYSVLACRGTLTGQSDESGVFVILDRNYNIVDIITTYSDGTLIGVLYCLNVDDNGNFYSIEYTGSRYRIVLMNNLAIKPANSNTYKAIKIETHNIPNQYSWESFLKVFKNDGNNKYFAVGNRNSSAGIVGCELTIEDTKTWKYHTSTYEKSNTLSIFDNGYNVYWDSESNLHFQIAVADYGMVMLSKGTGTGTTIAMKTKRYLSTDDVNQNGNFIFYSNQIGYYAYAVDEDPVEKYYIYRIDLSNKTSSLIYGDSGKYSTYDAIWLFKSNNSIFYYKIDLTNTANTYELEFAMIDNYSVYDIVLGTFYANSFINAFCYPNVLTNFNKNYIYIQNQDTLFSLNFLWSPNDYNGQPYISSSSLIPNKVGIEDENDIEIFNRNIFNLSNYGNQYTASANIPNYFLNNDNLVDATLYSKNNNLLVDASINTTKNIYEDINVNFINRFKIIDKKTNSQLENTGASALFVDAMLLRQVSAKIGKIQINYKDNTNEIKNISISSISGTTGNFGIAIYVNKLIKTIDLISEDETITYKTINCENLQLNKYYKIEFNVHL